MTAPHPPLAAVIAALCGVALLCGLGTWQAARLHWKNGLLARIEQAYAAPAPDLENRLAAAERDRYGFVFGDIHVALLPSRAIRIAPRTQNGQVGYHLILPGLLPEGRMILINAGWLPENASTSLTGDAPVAATLRGMTRRAEDASRFLPENDIPGNRWYRAAPRDLAATLPQPAPIPYDLVFYATSPLPATLGAEPAPAPFKPDWRPPNDHLQYAAFWYGMAVLLAVIFYLRFLRRVS